MVAIQPLVKGTAALAAIVTWIIYWVQLYRGLAKEQQESLLKFLRLIQVNTVSHIFGILDGSTYLNENKERFVLKTEADEEAINGDLQDIFLEMEED